MKEKEIMELITSEYSWEQVIYKIVAWEGLDPWDLDICSLSMSFLQYVAKLKDLDFKIPAKFLIIAAVLLRMKSDHLEFLEILQESMEPAEFGEEPGGEIESAEGGEQKFELTPITAPPTRLAKRKIMINELVFALKNVLKTQEKRERRRVRLRGDIKINQENALKRIDDFYNRVVDILKGLKEDEVRFSELVKKKDKKEVVNTFMPLVYLDNDRKLRCRQDEMFDEIFISRGEAR